MQDIDAAYMLGGSGDLDAGLSALLEVPDYDTRSSTDIFGGSYDMPPGAGNPTCTHLLS